MEERSRSVKREFEESVIQRSEALVIPNVVRDLKIPRYARNDITLAYARVSREA